MTDLIVFSVGSNRYALNIENIQRIIQAIELTSIPNSNELIDGMMSYEDNVIKVLNFRKLIGSQTYDEELKKLFLKFKVNLSKWKEDLEHSLENSSSFTKTVDPHKAELGAWIDNFNSYDDKVSALLKDLMESNKNLHLAASDVLEINNTDNEKAKSLFKTKIIPIYDDTVKHLDVFSMELDKVANSLQKLVLYENKGINFAIKVDLIEDIAHVEERMIMNGDEDHNNASEFLELQGVLDINGVLINVIKTVNLPS